MMMYYWVHDVKAKHVMLLEDIANWDTIVNYNKFFRIEYHNWLINQQVELGGFDYNGHPKYAEIDETYFFNQKYHHGRFRCGTWVIGILERHSGHCWLEVVPCRNAATLGQVISAHVSSKNYNCN